MRKRRFFSSRILHALVIAGVMGCAGCSSDDATDWAGCVIGGVHYGDGQGNPDNACQVCDAAASADSWTDDDGAGCDDGVFCNGADTCLGGACSQHAGDPCPDDGLYCNGAESCDESAGACDHAGSPCTAPELCSEDSGDCVLSCTGCAVDGVCYGDGQYNPQNSCQVCNAAAAAGSWSDLDGVACDDGVYCNGADTCLSGACSEHAGDPCAGQGMCDENLDDCVLTCTGCLIDGACYSDGQHDPQNSCRVCDPAAEATAWSDDDGADCDDGAYCNGADTCLAGACSQHAGDPCAAGEFCNEGADGCAQTCPGCIIDSICYSDGQQNPQNGCQVCDPAASASAWSDDDGADCDDGTFCNGPDSCLSGACSQHAGDPCPDDGLYCNGAESCNESGGTCDHSGDPCTLPEVCDEAADGCGLTCPGCTIDDVCYNHRQTDPSNACLICDVGFSTTDWTDNDGADCDDGTFCNGPDTCLAGACSEHYGDPCGSDGMWCNGSEYCSEASARCLHTGNRCTLPEICDESRNMCVLSCTGCAIDLVCYFDGMPNPQNVCQICDLAAAADAWTDNDAVACDDGTFCNGPDTCLGGSCSIHAGDPCTPPDYCDVGADVCVHPTPSEQIAAARALPDGAANLILENVYVTYTKAAVGDDNAGFFVQAEQAGPALFVEVDPAALGFTAGDEVTFTVEQMGTSQGRRQAMVISGSTEISSGNSLAGLVQDVSAATDLVTALDDYESELITAVGTLVSDPAFAGAGHVAAQVDTDGVAGETDLQLRITDTLNATYDLVTDCIFTVTRTPLWRVNSIAYFSAYSFPGLTVPFCPTPRVLGAEATSSNSVVITMSRNIEPTSVLPDGSQFTFDLGLTASAASASGNQITVLTSVQTNGVTYLVTVASTVTDFLGTGVDPTANSASFEGFP